VENCKHESIYVKGQGSVEKLPCMRWGSEFDRSKTVQCPQQKVLVKKIKINVKM